MKVRLDYNVTEEEFLTEYSLYFLGWDFYTYQSYIRSILRGILVTSVEKEVLSFLQDKGIKDLKGRCPEKFSYCLYKKGEVFRLSEDVQAIVISVGGESSPRLRFSQERIEKPWISLSDSEKLYIRNCLDEFLCGFSQHQWGNGKLLGMSYIFFRGGDDREYQIDFQLVWYPNSFF